MTCANLWPDWVTSLSCKSNTNLYKIWIMLWLSLCEMDSWGCQLLCKPTGHIWDIYTLVYSFKMDLDLKVKWLDIYNIFWWYFHHWLHWKFHQYDIFVSDFRITTEAPYLALMASYVVSIVRIWENIDHIITAPHCILSFVVNKT